MFVLHALFDGEIGGAPAHVNQGESQDDGPGRGRCRGKRGGRFHPCGLSEGERNGHYTGRRKSRGRRSRSDLRPRLLSISSRRGRSFIFFSEVAFTPATN